jgi:hypothetical protein
MYNILESRILTRLVAATGVILALVVYALRTTFPPFCIGFGFFFAVTLFLSLRLKRGKVYVYNIAFVFLALALAEYWFRDDGRPLTLDNGTHYEGPYSADYYRRDSELGYSVRPGRRTVDAVKKFNDGRVIYHVTYGIDEFGLRATPNIASVRGPVFFFGCSLTFGDGVSDAESLPYQYAILSGRRTRNFGLHGYGPHQMLRALETDRPKLLGIGESPVLVVYLALMTHLDRAAGRAVWDPNGPQYEVQGGKVEHVGQFSRSARILGYSRVVQRLATRRQRDLDRFSAIIRKSRDLVWAKYAAPFLVILWDTKLMQQGNADWLAADLNRAGIDVIRLSKALPALQANDYYIQFDGHPKGKAYADVANLIYHWSTTKMLADAPLDARVQLNSFTQRSR